MPVASDLLLFSCSVMSDSLRLHGLQHARLPCLSPSPGAYSNLFPLSWWWWCHPSCPLSPPSPPAFNLSQHHDLLSQLFQILWPKYWSFSFSISPSNEYSGLISFDPLAVQGTLKSLLQPHSLKASIQMWAFKCGRLLLQNQPVWWR